MKRMHLLAALLLGLSLGCGDDDGGSNENNGNLNQNSNQVQPVCGNGQVETGEQCDEGAGNSDTAPDACRTGCRLAGCGDGVVDSGETCDDGNTSNQDACLTTCGGANDCCVPNVCGDGWQDARPAGGSHLVEACDDGNTASDDDCRGDCLQDLSLCGNGTLEQGEACDPGEASLSDTVPNRCRTNCQVPSCGDGVVDDDFDEQCDACALAGQTCASIGQGFTHGDLACEASTCLFDTSGCLTCVDGDSDGAGVGPDCEGIQDCVDDDPLVHPGATEICNHIDDNCDGEIDEGGDAWCTSNVGIHSLMTCSVAGECEFAGCEEGYVDLNGSGDGCEYACTPTNGGVEICDTLDNDCDGVADDGFDKQHDPLNCGTCGNECTAGAHQSTSCQSGICDSQCIDGYFDADLADANGCECYPSKSEGFVQCTSGGPECDAFNQPCADPSGDGVFHCLVDEDLCDGIDNDCDGLVDEDSGSGSPCYTSGVGCTWTGSTWVCFGRCRSGTVSCDSGEYSCVNEVGPIQEVCADGVDNDCDDIVDTDC